VEWAVAPQLGRQAARRHDRAPALRLAQLARAAAARSPAHVRPEPQVRPALRDQESLAVQRPALGHRRVN
jgi:hypothetical protein